MCLNWIVLVLMYPSTNVNSNVKIPGHAALSLSSNWGVGSRQVANPQFTTAMCIHAHVFICYHVLMLCVLPNIIGSNTASVVMLWMTTKCGCLHSYSLYSGIDSHMYEGTGLAIRKIELYACFPPRTNDWFTWNFDVLKFPHSNDSIRGPSDDHIIFVPLKDLHRENTSTQCAM